jgi:hypothetical protein
VCSTGREEVVVLERLVYVRDLWVDAVLGCVYIYTSRCE